MDCAHKAPLSMEFSRQEYWSVYPPTLFSRGSSQLRNRTQVSHIAGRFFTFWATREALKTDFILVNSNYLPPLCNIPPAKKEVRIRVWYQISWVPTIPKQSPRIRNWNTHFLQDYSGGVLVISHFTTLVPRSWTKHNQGYQRSSSPLGPVMTGRWCCVNAVPREEVCEGEGLLKPDFSDFFSVVGDGIPGRKDEWKSTLKSWNTAYAT